MFGQAARRSPEALTNAGDVAYDAAAATMFSTAVDNQNNTSAAAEAQTTMVAVPHTPKHRNIYQSNRQGRLDVASRRRPASASPARTSTTAHRGVYDGDGNGSCGNLVLGRGEIVRGGGERGKVLKRPRSASATTGKRPHAVGSRIPWQR